MSGYWKWGLTGWALLGIAASAYGQRDLTGMSLEELMSVEVVSVSRKAESVDTVAGAITVITEEDIRRSTATNIVDLLRTVPGVHVARQDAHDTSVTVRGFSGVFANRVLVLVDGRSIYTPLFGGVFWEYNDLALEEIERIEVIRGPGASVWGANAVNGVINIITKSALDTTGGQLRLGAGNIEAHGYLGYTIPINERSALRLHANVKNHEGFSNFDGTDSDDGWTSQRVGLRYDWDDQQSNAVTVTADVLNHDQRVSYFFSEPGFPYRYLARGTEGRQSVHIAGGYTRTIREGNEFTISGGFEHFENDDIVLHERASTAELDFHHRIDLGEKHILQYGLGYRYQESKIRSTAQLGIFPERHEDQSFSAFLQDTISWQDGKYRLTLGTKLEWNEYTDLEIQPSAHLGITLADNKFIWFGISRAVRTPTRADRDAFVPAIGLPNTLAFLQGNRDFKSETLVALETGYRYRHPSDKFTLDLSAFYSIYDRLRTIELSRPGIQIFPFQIRIPFEARNNAEAHAIGFEVAADWRVLPFWMLRGEYSYQHIDLEMKNRGFDFITPSTERDTPRHKASLTSLFQVAEKWEFSSTLRYVGDLKGLDVDGYAELDLSLRWSPRENLTLALIGRDLLNKSHQEFSPTFLNALGSEVEQSIFGSVTWRF